MNALFAGMYTFDSVDEDGDEYTHCEALCIEATSKEEALGICYEVGHKEMEKHNGSALNVDVAEKITKLPLEL